MDRGQRQIYRWLCHAQVSSVFCVLFWRRRSLVGRSNIELLKDVAIALQWHAPVLVFGLEQYWQFHVG